MASGIVWLPQQIYKNTCTADFLYESVKSFALYWVCKIANTHSYTVSVMCKRAHTSVSDAHVISEEHTKITWYCYLNCFTLFSKIIHTYLSLFSSISVIWSSSFPLSPLGGLTAWRSKRHLIFSNIIDLTALTLSDENKTWIELCCIMTLSSSALYLNWIHIWWILHHWHLMNWTESTLNWLWTE